LDTLSYVLISVTDYCPKLGHSNQVFVVSSSLMNQFVFHKHTQLDLKEVGYEGVNWIQVAEDGVQRRELVNTVMNLRVP